MKAELTPIQEIINYCKELINDGNDVIYTESLKDWCENELIKKEKLKIVEAHKNGFYSPPFRMSRTREAEQYYNEIFNKENI